MSNRYPSSTGSIHTCARSVLNAYKCKWKSILGSTPLEVQITQLAQVATLVPMARVLVGNTYVQRMSISRCEVQQRAHFRCQHPTDGTKTKGKEYARHKYHGDSSTSYYQG